ncbi:PAS domain S-box protein [Microcoleus sp. N3A4]|uniref:PAS domain S-box protein n=1 Tax=Microcoleus sp. N3A4 TaxID=3055379 RepID=UPI002FD57644
MTSSFHSHSVPSENGLPQNSQKVITEADVLITAALADRPARMPDLAAENQALHILAQQLTDEPQSMLKTLVQIARDLCRCDTAGVSLLETLADGSSVFRWVAIAGALASLEQTTTPGNFSACRTTIQCGHPLLYARPERYFTYLHDPQFPIVEGLLLPLGANDLQLGTIWIVSHNEQRHFDREDLRLMTSLAGFTAAALQSIHQRQTAELALQREQAARLETEATRQALDEAAGRAVNILESITDAFMSLDGEWRITYVNQEVAKLNNVQRSEIIGKTHWEMWPWSVGTIVEQTYRQVVADQVAAHFEVLYEPLTMWLEIHAYPAIAGLSIYYRDITDRKQSELVLVEQKRLLELTASGQPLEQCFSALCASMSKLNPHVSACVLLTDARRQTFPRLIAPDLPPSFSQGLKDAPINELAIGTCGEAVYRNQPVTCADIARDDRWSQEWRDLCVAHGVLACHSAPIPGVDRLPLGSLMLCFGEARMPTDWEYRLAEFGAQIASIVLERDRSSLAVRESEAKYRTLTELSTHHVWMLDAAGELVFLNQSFLDYFGKPFNELQREKWPENVHHPDDRDRIVQEIASAIATGRNIRYEHRLRRHDNQFRWFLNEATPWRDANGEIAHWIGASVDIDDSKQAEAALRDSEEKFRNMADNAPFMVWVTDPRGYCHYLSQSWYDFTGQTPETGLGFGWLNMTHPDDREYAEQTFVAANQRQEAFRVEYRLRRKDGEYIWAIDMANPWLGPEGQFKGYIGSVIDIDDRKQGESALRRSEERYRTLFESIDEGFCVIEMLFDENDTPIDYRFLEINPVFEEQTGLRQALGKTARQLLPDLEDYWIKIYGQVALTGESVRFESGSEVMNRWFDVYACRTGQPEERKVAIVFKDISDRKRIETERIAAQKALQASEEQSRNILESITDGFFALDRDWRFTYVNRQGERLLDRTPGDLLGKVIWEEYPSAVGLEFERAYRQTASERVASSFISFYPDHNRWYEVQAYPAADGITVYFRNVTDRQRIEAEREQILQREQNAREVAENANRIKDEFLAVLSHELRSPLNPILGWSRLLQNGKLDASKTALGLATIERNAQLQSRLIEDLLNVSRILQGKLSLTVSPVNLASTIRAAIETVQLAAEAKSIGVEVSLDPNISSVSGDATRLQQVVWNLLSNAVKFTPAGGRVEVRLAQADNQAQITVRDNGKGIPSEFLPYVFDYFRQADSSTTRQFGGLGLGLAIVRHLVELHGGTVKADSPGEGLGATFTVRLPLLPISPAKNQAEQFSQPSLNLQGVRVLVVDDDIDSREFVVFLLQQAQASVISASSAEKAFAALRQSKPDIVLSDIGMPNMDGYMLMRQVRALPPEQGGQIPAIALTAYAGDFNQKQALAAGFQRHVAKPIEPNELLKAIVTLLRRQPR